MNSLVQFAPSELLHAKNEVKFESFCCIIVICYIVSVMQSGETPFMRACHIGSMEVVKWFVEECPIIGQRVTQSTAALHKTVSYEAK